MNVKRAPIGALGAAPVKCAAIILTIILSTSPARSGDENQSSLSGVETNALVAAYDASGLDKPPGPPSSLQSYVIAIHPAGTYVDVFFLSQTQVLAVPAIIDTTNNKVVWTDRDRTAPPHEPNLFGLVLPGIVAGEMIAAYRQAQSDGFGFLTSGAYSTTFTPYSPGLRVSFTPTGISPWDAFANGAAVAKYITGRRGSCSSPFGYSVILTRDGFNVRQFCPKVYPPWPGRLMPRPPC